MELSGECVLTGTAVGILCRAEEEENKDYFVHLTGVIGTIKDGDSVEFELEEDKKGMRAVNVKQV